MADNVMPSLTVAHAAFGVVATVTPRGGSPVTTTALRTRGATPPAIGSLSLGPADGVALRDLVSIPRADVASLPEGSQIEADFGDGLRIYRVDRVDAGFPDEWRAVVS